MSFQYPDDATGRALTRIQSDGSDMSREMVFDFTIDCRAKKKAENLIDNLASAFDNAECYFDEEDQLWIVVLQKKIVPSHHAVFDIETLVEATAQKEECIYSGFGSFGNN